MWIVNSFIFYKNHRLSILFKLLTNPRSIHFVITGYSLYFAFSMFFGHFFYLFSWNSGINTVTFYYRVFYNNCPSGYYGTAAYYCIIHYNGTHTNQYIVCNSTSVYNSIMTNRYIVANSSFSFFVRTMHTRTILNVYVVAYANFIYIAANNTAKPYTTSLAENHISNNCSIWCNKTIRCNLWSSTSCRKNNRHFFV